MKLVMLGAPGAGKGSQAITLSEKLNIPHISTGDIFRANIKEGTPLGVKAKEFIDKGELVPDELVTDLVVDRVGKDDCKNGYILDGFPRTIPQARDFKKAIEDKAMKIDFAINLLVDDDVIVGRMGGRRACLNCGATYNIVNMPPKKEGICDHCGERLVLRDDDKPETVKNRLTVYHEKTQPLIDFYKEEGCLVDIDGTKAPDEVFKDITRAIGV